jgi:hypothetical protein
VLPFGGFKPPRVLEKSRLKLQTHEHVRRRAEGKHRHRVEGSRGETHMKPVLKPLVSRRRALVARDIIGRYSNQLRQCRSGKR